MPLGGRDKRQRFIGIRLPYFCLAVHSIINCVAAPAVGNFSRSISMGVIRKTSLELGGSFKSQAAPEPGYNLLAHTNIYDLQMF
jgi:hypothetical protein